MSHITFSFAAAPRSARHGNMKGMEPLLRFLLQLIDRINKYKLSKEVRVYVRYCMCLIPA